MEELKYYGSSSHNVINGSKNDNYVRKKATHEPKVMSTVDFTAGFA
jgi:hypothetical protein